MGYMAPEQLRGDPVDTRTDVFAFGCVLYEMLSGRRPFAGGSSADYVSAALRDDPAPLEDSLSVGLRAIVRRCLEKRPAARYQSAGELVAVLETLDPDSLGAVSGAQSAPPIRATSSGAEPAVAVMPFANLSNDVEQEYFCDGMTEEILGAIGKVRGLRVLARSSSFAFKGRDADPREVGRTIGADHLLEGSVRRFGDRVRISARLVQATDGTQLWADRYDRTISDIFELQDEISIEVANQLRTALFMDEIADLRQRHIPDREANDLYLRGRYLWYRRREGDLQAAIGLFEQAIAKDPSTPMPHAGIAEVFCVLGVNCIHGPQTRLRPGAGRARSGLRTRRFRRLRLRRQGRPLRLPRISLGTRRGGLRKGHRTRTQLGLRQVLVRRVPGRPAAPRRVRDPGACRRRRGAHGAVGPGTRRDQSAQCRVEGRLRPTCVGRSRWIPNHPTVNHYFGQKLADAGRYEEAIPYLEIGFRAGIICGCRNARACVREAGTYRARRSHRNAQLDELASKRYVSPLRSCVDCPGQR